MSQTVRRIEAGGKTVVLLGTAHISRESAEEVARVISEERPDRVCVELDEGRWKSMTQAQAWEKLDIVKVLKEKKGFLLLANLMLSSFQRRLGANLGMKPGEEMRAAVETAQSLGIPYSFCDREVQVTLRRAWVKSNFWNKNKLLTAILGSAFSREKVDEKQIEELKEGTALDSMMGELSSFLPSVKETLIDERDRFLAAKINQAEGSKIVAVVGAGHCPGIESWLGRFGAEPGALDLSDISGVPEKKKVLSNILGLAIPAAIVGLIAWGFFKSGASASLAMLLKWVILNGSLAGVGALLAFGHPLAILAAVAGAPIATLNPVLAVGMFSGLAQAFVRKPTVNDFKTLPDDITSLRGFYRNRVTRILLVFFLSSIGGMVGNFISIPSLASALG